MADVEAVLVELAVVVQVEDRWEDLLEGQDHEWVADRLEVDALRQGHNITGMWPIINITATPTILLAPSIIG